MTIFLVTLPYTYYDPLIGHEVASFANLVQTGEKIEDGFKTKKKSKKKKVEGCQSLFIQIAPVYQL